MCGRQADPLKNGCLSANQQTTTTAPFRGYPEHLSRLNIVSTVPREQILLPIIHHSKKIAAEPLHTRIVLTGLKLCRGSLPRPSAFQSDLQRILMRHREVLPSRSIGRNTDLSP